MSTRSLKILAAEVTNLAEALSEGRGGDLTTLVRVRGRWVEASAIDRMLDALPTVLPPQYAETVYVERGA